MKSRLVFVAKMLRIPNACGKYMSPCFGFGIAGIGADDSKRPVTDIDGGGGYELCPGDNYCIVIFSAIFPTCYSSLKEMSI